MPTDHQVEVLARQDYDPDTFRLDLSAPELAGELRPGQFLMVRIPAGGRDPLLRRPLGYLNRQPAEGRISLLARVVGRGTAALQKAASGDKLSVLGPLGRGFTLADKGPVLLVAGGLGLVPLHDLAIALASRVPVTMVYGARCAGELYEASALGRLPLQLILATDDGSAGRRGTTLDAVGSLDLKRYSFCYACGPRPMLAGLQSLLGQAGLPGEFSLEERMACGFGVCLGCVVAVKASDNGTSYRRVCTDGPVFPAGEVIFDA